MLQSRYLSRRVSWVAHSSRGELATSRAISESDWKVFRRIHPIALERFCQQVLADVERTAADTQQTSHERYLALYELMRRRDKELADAFDDLRRSTAIERLAGMLFHGLVTDEEMNRFSAEIRETCGSYLGIGR